MKIKYFAILATCAALLAGATACAPSGTQLNSGLVERLKNRGPVVLSTDNPYLAANMFVASAVEGSSIINGFVKYKGVPTAVEVEQGWFSPMLLHFYYPDNRESYTLEEALGTWIIHGPDQIPFDKLTDVARMTRNHEGQPMLATKELEGRSLPLPSPKPMTSDTAAAPAKDNKGLDAAGRNLKQMAEENEKLFKSGFKSPAKESSIGEPSAAPDSGAAKVSALQKAARSHPAELAPNGDLVHHVTYAGETLSVIARWYTGDPGNVGRIARINKIARPNDLQLGDTVVVPNYLLKNKSRLTEEGLKELIKIGIEEKAGVKGRAEPY